MISNLEGPGHFYVEYKQGLVLHAGQTAVGSGARVSSHSKGYPSLLPLNSAALAMCLPT